MIESFVLKKGVLGNRIYSVVNDINESSCSFSGHRYYQEKFLEHIINNKFSKISSPTGSGKSKVILAAAAYFYKIGISTIIAVPKMCITNNFCNETNHGKFVVNTSKLELILPSLSVIQEYQNKKDNVRKILKSVGPHVIVCSYDVLCSCVDLIDDRFLVVIDEAHHLASGINNIGKAVDSICHTGVKDSNDFFDAINAAFYKVHSYKFLEDETFEEALVSELESQGIPHEDIEIAVNALEKVRKEYTSGKKNENAVGWPEDMDGIKQVTQDPHDKPVSDTNNNMQKIH